MSNATLPPAADTARRAGPAGTMPKLPALDGMRAIAILIVMVAHADLERYVPGGLGVTIFFFLSGYLITTLLRLEFQRHGGIDLRQFYVKRTLRIFPPMYVTILIVTALTLAGLIDRPITVSGLLADSAFLTNYAPQLSAGPGVAIPLWSLDVEEHFYILFSTLFAFVLCRMQARRAAAVCTAIALLVLVGRIVFVLSHDTVDQVFYWSHTRVDSILWGCVLALWRNPVADDTGPPPPWLVGGAMLTLALCIVIRDPVFRETIRYTLQGIALLVLFSFVLQNRRARVVLGAAPLRIVALLSYTLYLIHMPAIAAMKHLAVPLPAVAGLVVAFVYAALMYRLVERPLGRWRRRLDA